jgi:hypothetical protein
VPVRPLELASIVAASILAVWLAVPDPPPSLSWEPLGPEIAPPALPGSVAVSPDGVLLAVLAGDRLEIRATGKDSVRVLLREAALSGGAVTWANDRVVLYTTDEGLNAIDVRLGVPRVLTPDLPGRVVAMRVHPSDGALLLRFQDGSAWRLDGLPFPRAR